MSTEDMARLSRLDEVRRRLFSDDTSLLRRPRNVRRATTSSVTGVPTSLYEGETPRCRVACGQQRGQNQKLVPHDGDHPNDAPEEEARLLRTGSLEKACLNRTKASFDSTTPADNQSYNLAIHRSLAGKKSKRAVAAKHNGRRSRKLHKQTSKYLVQSDSSGPFAVAGKQKGERPTLRCIKVKPRFSRLATPLEDGVKSASKEVGSHEGGLPKFPDAEAQGSTASDVDPAELPFSCRPPAFLVYQDSSTYSRASDPTWRKQTSKYLVQSDSSGPFAVAGKQKGERPALRCLKLKPRFSRLATPLEDEVSASKEEVGSHEGGLPKFPDAEAQGSPASDVDPSEELPFSCRPPAFLVYQDSSTYSKASDPTWNRSADSETVHPGPVTSTPLDRTESMDLRLVNPFEVLSVSPSGRVVERHIQDAWIERSDCGASPSGNHGTQAVVPDISAMRREKSEIPITTILSKGDTIINSSICGNCSLTDDTVQNIDDYEMTPPTPLSGQLKSGSLEMDDNSVCYMYVPEKQENRAFGDCSENSLKALQPLRKAIERLSPVRGECDADLPPLRTYIYHEMRKGGLCKNLGPLSSRNRVPQEVSQNYVRSLSFDHTRYPKASKLALLERSSPAGCTREGKPLLKASGLGASGTASASKATQRAHIPTQPVGQGCSGFENQGTGATLLSDSPAVEEQQPFKRILLFKKNAAICPGVLLVALALLACVAATFLHSKVITSKRPQFFTPRMSGSFLVAKNRSFVAQDAVKEEYDTCATPACKRDGAYLKGLLSWDLDPCEDFYHFVCSRWKGGGTTKTNVAAAASDELNHQLEQSVHGVLQRSSSPENLATLKALFYECMNTRQLDLDDWNPMLELLWLVSLEGFPFSSTPRNSTSLWKIAARVLKMTGAEALLSIQATAHPTKGDTGILSIGMPTMLAPKGSDQAQVTQFYNSTAFACITALKKQRNPTAYSLEVAAFASRLEMLVYTYTVSVGLPTRRAMLLKTQPELSTFFVELFLNSDSPLYSGGHTEVLIQSPAFFDALVTLLRNTEHYIVMNYLGIRLMIEVAAYAPSSGRPLVHTLVQHIYGRPRPSLPRWKLCVRSAERALPDLFLYASKLAFKTHFAIDMVQRLLGSLRLQLVRSLSRLAVLDRDSRARADILLNSTRFRLFRPNWLNNHEKLEGYVTALPRVVRGQSLRSFYTLHSHSFTESLRREEADRWQGSAFDHDCTFDGNTVYVPVLMFNFTQFTHDTVQSLQLSSSGVRIVRCLLQMVMNSVASGSSAGAVASRVWWPDMSSSFLAVTQLCFQQYGVRKLGALELLQYTAAMTPAMDLFQEEKRLDVRFETFQTYSIYHLFFVYHALSLCEDSSADNTTESTLAAFLTNVPLWNNRQFQETFRCPVGSNMNPSRKCILWRDTR